MKIYEDKYEKVFTGYEKTSKKCNIDEVSPYNNIPSNTSLYVNEFKKEMKAFEVDTFDHLVKITWLRRRFCYKGDRRMRNGKNGHVLDSAYALFTRYHVGFETRFLYRSNFAKIVTYLDDLFPNFDEGNPFKESYKYPYKVITLSHMVLVYQMEDRIELLEYADKKGLSYVEFLDFIINHINCHNDELGKNEYEFLFSSGDFLHYVKKMF